MKYIVLSLIIALLLSTASFLSGQTPEDSLRAFYPLQVGDYWEYGIQFPSSSQTVWRHVTKDTMLSNGERFLVIVIDDNYDHSFRDTLYERVTEDFEILRYFSNEIGTGEQLLYKLDAEKGDTWTSSDSINTFEVTLDSVYSEQYLSENRIHKSFQTRPMHFNVLVRGIGLAIDRDEFASNGLWLRGAIIDGVQHGTITSVGRDDFMKTIFDFELVQNYPNPFNASTTITFSLSDTRVTKVVIYNLVGQKVKTLVDEVLFSGTHSISWDGRDATGREVPSNIYFLKLSVGDRVLVRRMILLR